MLLTCIIALVFFLSPSDAYAWGPATHLEFASKALQFITLFSPLVKKLLTKYEDHFLYGSIAADITIGKNIKGYLHNCHNWEVAFNIFENKAKKDHQKAFMVGYLSHLAADTVAHNFFIPYKLIRSWDSKLLKHVYWELRMDLSVPDKYWALIKQFIGHNYSDNDYLLEGHLKKTLFPFKTNKKIFNGLLLFQQMKQYRKAAHTYVKRSTWTLTDKDIHMYKKLSQKAVVDFLINLKNSFCLNADPTGKLKMLYAKDTIKRIRRASKTKQITQKQLVHLIKDIKNNLRDGIYQKSDLPELENYLE